MLAHVSIHFDVGINAVPDLMPINLPSAINCNKIVLERYPRGGSQQMGNLVK